MRPDPELLEAALGASPSSLEPTKTGGYTRSLAWRVATRDGLAFLKQAEDEGSLHMLRREALVYQRVRGSFLPVFVGFVDSGTRALLALEFLADAYWPPPYPDDVEPLFAALEDVRLAALPEDLPAQGARGSRWESVASDPEPFLGLGLCSSEWLDGALGPLIAAESRADFTGNALVHNDVYSGNVCFAPRGAVLVDWGAAVRGSPWIDVAFALLSVRVEGGTPPLHELPDEGAFAAALAGHFADEAPRPLPPWAQPGSTLREDMRGDLEHALAWCVETLGLEPLR